MTHYLTQILITPEVIVKERVSDSYSIHRVVYDQFEKKITESDEIRPLPLWEESTEGNLKKIVILSAEKPIVSDDAVSRHLTCISFPEKIFESKHHIFKITVNPVIKTNGKQVPIRNRANIAEWFCKRSENHGFKVKKESLVVDSVHADIFSKKGHKVTICKAKITGELEVTDLSKSSPRCGDVSAVTQSKQVDSKSSPRCGDVSSQSLKLSILKRSSPRCGDVSNTGSSTSKEVKSSPRCGDVSTWLTLLTNAKLSSPRCGDVSATYGGRLALNQSSPRCGDVSLVIHLSLRHL